LTDKLTGSAIVEKTFTYITGLTRECRKAVTLNFEREHKGIPFDSAEAVMAREVESWFVTRDRNIKLDYIKSTGGRSGQVSFAYSGATKDAHFKIYVDSLFTLVGSSDKASAYLKSLNLRVDKRDFTK